jgi:integrase
MPRLPAGYTKERRKNKDGTTRTYIGTRFYKYDATGKRKRVVVYGRTLEEAKVKREKEETHPIASFAAYKMPLSTYLTLWLERSNREKAWSPRTKELYSLLLKNHIEPYLGMISLGKLSKEHISMFFDVHKVGSRTRQQVQLLLRAGLGAAVENDIIRINPVGKMPAHRYRQFRSLTKEEAWKLLECARKSDHLCLIYLAFSTGMRQGELFGLRWGQIDFRMWNAHAGERQHRAPTTER